MNIFSRLKALSPLPIRTALTPVAGPRTPESNALEAEIEVTRQFVAGEISQATYRFLVETLAAHPAVARVPR